MYTHVILKIEIENVCYDLLTCDAKSLNCTYYYNIKKYDYGNVDHNVNNCAVNFNR